MSFANRRFSPPTEGGYISEPKRKRRGNRHLPRVFVGADGEGVNVPRRFSLPVGSKGWIHAKHEYRLLRVGEYALETGKELTTWECLAFLADLPVGPLYVSYFFSYDTTMILKDAPKQVIQEMLTEKRDPKNKVVFRSFKLTSPKGDVYEVGYVPKKEFRVRREGRPHFITIQDVGTFFQSPFVVALDKWGIGLDNERDIIKAGKEARPDVRQIDDETRYYNQMEIAALEQLMDAFRGVCKDIGYMPAKWEGPGNLASAVLSAHKVPRRDDLDLPNWLVSNALLGLHFGRFELPMVGQVAGPVYGYDINSAYPYAMTQLPCLLHGRWVERKDMPDEGLFLAKGSFAEDPSMVTCSLPVRKKDGSIYYPRMGSGAWWSPELSQALRRGMDWQGESYYVYLQRCSCRPFEWVPELYEERIRLGEVAKGMVIKLALNSLYGKMAQTKGAAPWFNPVYAGLITSITRAMLLEATNGNGSDVVMYATDALFTLQPRELPAGKVLGHWGMDYHRDGMLTVQPGLYFGSALDKSGGIVAPKTRGLPRFRVLEHREDFSRAWRSLVEEGTWSFDRHKVSIELQVFLGLKVAYHLNRPELAGQWVQTSRAAGFDWRTKRSQPLSDGSKGWVGTAPHLGNAMVPSIPYTPAFRDEMEAELVKEEWWRLADAVDWGDVWGMPDDVWSR